jgi:hypothetical protein
MGFLADCGIRIDEIIECKENGRLSCDWLTLPIPRNGKIFYNGRSYSNKGTKTLIDYNHPGGPINWPKKGFVLIWGKIQRSFIKIREPHNQMKSYIV